MLATVEAVVSRMHVRSIAACIAIYMNVNIFLRNTNDTYARFRHFFHGCFVITFSIWILEYVFLAIWYLDLDFRIGLFVDVFCKY